jgi:CRP-like cAMP-binding protein
MAGTRQRDRRLERLAEVPLFAACSKRELLAIAQASDLMEVPLGYRLIEQGSTGAECFVLVDGQVRVTRNSHEVGRLGPGACFGELSLLDRGVRTATVETETPATVLALGRREFATVLDTVPSINHKLLATLAGRVRELDAELFG